MWALTSRGCLRGSGLHPLVACGDVEVGRSTGSDEKLDVVIWVSIRMALVGCA